MALDAANSSTAATGESSQAPEDVVDGSSMAPATDDAALVRIEQLLRVKDDTSRFVALALLKAVLDSQAVGVEGVGGGTVPATTADSSEAASEPQEPHLLRLWAALPIKFLDKLLRAGLNAPATRFLMTSSTAAAAKAGVEAAHMRDLAVAVLHTFATRILPDGRRGDARLVGRIPLLVASLLNTEGTGLEDSNEGGSGDGMRAEPTLTLILQTLVTLVSRPEGAVVFNRDVADLSPLTELAPTQPLVLEVLLRAWLYGLLSAGQEGGSAAGVLATIDATLPALVATFKGTDGVTLLDFLARLLRNAEALAEQQQQALIPSPNPACLQPVAALVRRLAASRPTAAARAAYTHAAAALLRVYPDTASALLFGAGGGDDSQDKDKPFAYLFVSMLLVDLRATLPGLLARLNDRAYYAATAARLASVYDILSAFIGYLVRSLDDDDSGSSTLTLTPDNLLRLRTSMSETLSLTAEHLRDRWDAAVAGAQGLHPDARSGVAAEGHSQQSPFSHPLDAAGALLSWDAADPELVVSRDPLVLAAVRALALWLREDDNAALRREAAGLADMLMDLYASSADSSQNTSNNLDFRSPVLVALEGLTAGDTANGDGDSETTVALLLEHNAWTVLTADLLDTLQRRQSPQDRRRLDADAARGTEIVRVLLPIVESERPGTREAWMDVITLVAAWAGPDDDGTEADAVIAEFRVAVLQLVTALVANAHPAVVRRYMHSIAAVIGLARQLRSVLTASYTQLGPVAAGLAESLEDVQTTLESLRP